MNPDNVSTIKPGVVIEGNGASRGATILMNKQADEGADVILCLAPESPHHPFVVWTYHHARGTCMRGDYFDNLPDAINIYNNRGF
jgi:hypothetical protein